MHERGPYDTEIAIIGRRQGKHAVVESRDNDTLRGSYTIGNTLFMTPAVPPGQRMLAHELVRAPRQQSAMRAARMQHTSNPALPCI